jgi:GAF domain-containing protein
MSSNTDRSYVQPDEIVGAVMRGPDQIINRELAAIIPIIASVMGRRLQATSSSFYIYSQNGTRTVAVFRHGEAKLFFPEISDSDAVSPRDIPVEAEILETARSVRRSNPEDFRRWPMIHDELRYLTSDYADVAVPLCRQNRVYGVAYLWRYGPPGPFTDAEVQTAENLASVAAMAVESARQYSEERARRLHLNALLNVASLAASHLTVDRVMPAVTQIVRSVTDADVCNLYVFDDSGNAVIDSYTSGLNEREKWVFDQSHEYSVESVPCELRARETLAPVVVRDPEQDLAAGSELVKYCREGKISEILVVPIVYQYQMIGVMYLWYRDISRVFSVESISTVQGISNQAGGVVSQARLFDHSRQHIAETEALRKIGETVLHSDSLNTGLDQIADVLNRMIPYDYAFAGMIDKDDDSVVVERLWGKFPPSLLKYRISLSHSLTGEAVRTGQIINVAEALQDPRMHRFAHQHLSIRSVLISPLVTENGIVGVLYIGREDGEGFTKRQERLMALLCQQAAVAIERTKAREALALHAQRQTFLAKVTNRLIAVPDPIQALQDIAEAGSEVLADGVAIALSTWEYGKLRWEGCAHADPELNLILRDEVLGGKIIVDRDRVESILASKDASLTPLVDGRPADGKKLDPTVVRLLKRLGSRQMLTVPMRQLGRAPGLLVLVASDPNVRLDHDLQEMAQIVANRIGDALERRQMAHNREALLRVSEAINTHADLEDLLDMFAAELHRIVPYDQMYLGRIDPETSHTYPLTYLNSHGLTAEDVEMTSN